jgi:hypothetical protein
MYSGLDRERTALRRQRSVAWAWIKARGITRNRTEAAHAKLTSSVLLTTDCSQVEEIASWRDNLAAFNCRSLARQICEQFYDLSILTRRDSPSEAVAAGRAFGASLSSTRAEDEDVQCDATTESRPRSRARIMTAVLPETTERRGVLISIKTRAA